jgi:sugar-specific transcriptional regulator TrmB
METCKEAQPIELYDESLNAWKLIKKGKKPLKSMKIIENMLQNLGLSKNEVQVYVYLALSKERKAGEIAEALNLHRTNTYRILGDLEKKGIVSSVFEKPLKFIATPFDRAVNKLIETKKLKIQRLERKKENLINLWLSLPKPEIKERRKEVFQILEGEEQINLKATEVVQNAQREINVFASEEDLPRFYNSGFMDLLERRSKKLDVNLLTINLAKSRFFVEKMKLHKRYVPVENAAVPSFILVDRKQLIFMIRRGNEKGARPRISALWTNYEAFTQALSALFRRLWTGATE